MKKHLLKQEGQNNFVPKENRFTAIQGILSPIDWDFKGNVIKFSIYSDDDEDYIIKNNYKIEKLKKLLGKKVDAIGEVKSGRNHEKLLFLKKIMPSLCKRKKKKTQELTKHLWLEEYSLNIPSHYQDSISSHHLSLAS